MVRWKGADLARLFVRAGRYTSIVIVGGSALLILFRSFIQAFVPLNSTQLLAVSIAALAALLVDFAKAVGRIGSVDSASMRHLSLAEGIRLVLAKGGHPGIVRVLGTTTASIQPILRDCLVGEDRRHVVECRVLFHSFAGRRDSSSQRLVAETKIVGENWAHLALHEGVIDRVSVRTLDFNPSMLCVIADNRALVFGLYYPAPRKGPTAFEYIEPIYIECGSTATNDLIAKFTSQFDRMFENSTGYIEAVSDRMAQQHGARASLAQRVSGRLR